MDEKTKILVLDDERLIRMTLSAKLRMIGYTAVAVATVNEALALLNKDGHRQFKAIITDIVMEEMDGFVFRDIVRGLDPTMPIFFLTALDPEEGGGFLQKILGDPNSYYLPKSAKAEVLLRRVQSIVASRRVEQFIERQMEETRQTMTLAAQVQRSMLPMRAMMTDNAFYTTWWQPKDVVSGDLYEVEPFGHECHLFVLGDIQGHGISAALAMTAVQSHLRQLTHRSGAPRMEPHDIANLLQHFFRESLPDVSYMTALICIHRPLEGVVDWISCGAPDLAVLDPENPDAGPVNPEKRGGVPIGMLPDTVYTKDDVVHTRLTESAVCVAHSDGILDISRDAEGLEKMPDEERQQIRNELIMDAQRDRSIVAAPYKFMAACEAMGYSHFTDDVTEMIFGGRLRQPDTFVAMVPISVEAIDRVAMELDCWCTERGWGVDVSTRVQLVYEEKLMNLYDHGFDYRQRLREAACVRLRMKKDCAELTIWDCGTQDPSLEVAAGSTDVAFDLANQRFSGRGRGRLMVRDMCKGIARNRYGILNETVYFIPLEREGSGEKDGAE